MKRIIIPYNPNLKISARKLRANMTYGEIRLWNQLKHKQILGYDFHRQKPLGRFIVDFFCNELMLAIEIDGSSHQGTRLDKDVDRQTELEQLGIFFLRFTEAEVLNNIDGVVLEIESWIKLNTPPTPSQEGNA